MSYAKLPPPSMVKMMNSDATLRVLNVNDCPAVALIHTRAFPKSSLTRLGFEAVRRYYVSQLEGSNKCLALGAFQDDVMVGYIFAGEFLNGVLSDFLISNQLFLIGRVFSHPWLALDPMFRDAVKLALQKLRQRRRSPVAKKVTKEKGQTFVVLSIAVDPHLQNKGTGQKLMDFTEMEASKSGFMKMSLSVNQKNNKAILFYEKNGWRKAQNYYGKIIEMTKQLKP